MKKLLCLVLVLGLGLAMIKSAFAEYVNGYTRSNGTVVQGYNRSSSNSTVRDNYSYAGNTNPSTGAVGTNHYRNSPSSEYYNPFASSSNKSNMFGSNND